MIIGARVAKLTDVNIDVESCSFVAAADVEDESRRRGSDSEEKNSFQVAPKLNFFN